jgi:hypothetical protein
MASFAKIGLDSKVIEVLSVHNDELKDSNGNEVEQLGIDFLTILTGWSVWKQTSYNTRRGEHRLSKTPLRKNHAGIGYIYDADRDAFIPPKPYPSWLLDEDTCRWDAPTPYPDDGKRSEYDWDEPTTSWREI